MWSDPEDIQGMLPLQPSSRETLNVCAAVRRSEGCGRYSIHHLPAYGPCRVEGIGVLRPSRSQTRPGAYASSVNLKCQLLAWGSLTWVLSDDPQIGYHSAPYQSRYSSSRGNPWCRWLTGERLRQGTWLFFTIQHAGGRTNCIADHIPPVGFSQVLDVQAIEKGVFRVWLSSRTAKLNLGTWQTG